MKMNQPKLIPMYCMRRLGTLTRQSPTSKLCVAFLLAIVTDYVRFTNIFQSIFATKPTTYVIIVTSTSVGITSMPASTSKTIKMSKLSLVDG